MLSNQQNKKITLIAAVASNRVIGANNQLIWHLPADLKYFKAMTMHKTIIMGRKTFESIGRPLPNRNNIIITGNSNFKAEGCLIENNLQSALDKASGDEIMIIGGASLYEQAMDVASTLLITEVHHQFEGDTFFPEINKAQWIEVNREDHQQDINNIYDYSLVTYKRK